MITPCLALCKINRETRTCEGCNRTIEEITNWSKYSDEERLVVMKRLGYSNGRRGRQKRHELKRIDMGKP